MRSQSRRKIQTLKKSVHLHTNVFIQPQFSCVGMMLSSQGFVTMYNQFLRNKRYATLPTNETRVSCSRTNSEKTKTKKQRFSGNGVRKFIQCIKKKKERKNFDFPMKLQKLKLSNLKIKFYSLYLTSRERLLNVWKKKCEF